MHPATTFLSFAEQLADAARAAILPFWRSGLAIDDKLDHSPVTQADRQSELAMRSLIEQHYPNHGIVGEEFGRVREDAEWVWVLDPIDGTKSFIVGRPTFCTLIGLLHYGKPVLGVIDQPVLQERWLGVSGQPSTLNGQVIHTSSICELAKARLGSTGPQYLVGKSAHFNALAEQARFTVWGGDAYLYGLLALGGYELVIETGLKLHDFAALAPVVIGAGGLMTDWQGKPLSADSDGSVLAAANAQIHQQAMQTLSPA